MKKFLRFFLIMMLILSLTACNKEPAGNNKELESELDVLHVGYQVDPEGLDPHRTAAASTFSITNNIYDTLVDANEKWEINPRLAKSWKISEDGMEILFELRDDVKFHDGKELTSMDVKYSFERLKDKNSPKSRDYENISNIEIIDDYNIKFITETLDVELIKNFAYPWTAIVPVGEDEYLKTTPIGTGAYKLNSWIPQSSIVLERNDDYYDEKANIKTIKLELIPDATSMMAALQVGKLDIIPLTGNQVKMIEDNDEYNIIGKPMNAVQIMSLNTQNKILSSKKVRQAISMAINKDEVIEASMFGYGDKIGSHLPTTSPDYYDTNDIVKYDPEMAKKLLKEAGYEQGFDIKLSLPKNYQMHVDAGQIIADHLSKIGINVSIELIEWGTWVSDVYGSKNFEMTIVGHTGRLDSYAFLSRYKSNSDDYISLTTGEVDDLLENAIKEKDNLKRKELYKQIQINLANELPAIYLQTPYTLIGTQKNIKGMKLFPMDIYEYKSVYFEN